MISKNKIYLYVFVTCIYIFLYILICPYVYADENFAVEVVDNTIEVSVGFDGSSIEVFVDRQNVNSDIIVIVDGPRKDITIWKKERILGAWVNRYYMTFKNMPIYYNYASTVPLDNDVLKDVFLHNQIGHEALFASLKTKGLTGNSDDDVFKKALLKQKYRKGVYFSKPEKVNFISPHLFRVSFDVPPSAQTGNYKIHSFLIEKGHVTHEKIENLNVKQVGLNAMVVSEASEHSFRYAVVVIMLALFCGWLASIIKVRA